MPIPAQPVLFTPAYQVRVWGGRRIETALGRSLPDAQPYGESWEMSDRDDCQSRAAEGPLAGMTLNDLWNKHRPAIFGTSLAAHPSRRFPLLIKVLDCAADLSIQVHPPASRAAELGGEPKSEMWYVADAEPGALLYAGLRAGVTRDGFRRALADGTVAECIHSMEAVPGNSLMVHSGRVHALGGGLLVFEIQQNSDTTYRVFDWNRNGLDGKPRQLHIEESMQCIDFDDFEPQLHPADAGNPLADCDHFTVNLRQPGDPMHGGDDTMSLLMAVTPLKWGGIPIPAGAVALWPACQSPAPAPEGGEGGKWLEIHVR